MHKDPPPTLLERPIRDIVIYGVLTGLAASVIIFGAYTLLSGKSASAPHPLPASQGGR